MPPNRTATSRSANRKVIGSIGPSLSSPAPGLGAVEHAPLRETGPAGAPGPATAGRDVPDRPRIPGVAPDPAGVVEPVAPVGNHPAGVAVEQGQLHGPLQGAVDPHPAHLRMGLVG